MPRAIALALVVLLLTSTSAHSLNVSINVDGSPYTVAFAIDDDPHLAATTTFAKLRPPNAAIYRPSSGEQDAIDRLATAIATVQANAKAETTPTANRVSTHDVAMGKAPAALLMSPTYANHSSKNNLHAFGHALHLQWKPDVAHGGGGPLDPALQLCARTKLAALTAYVYRFDTTAGRAVCVERAEDGEAWFRHFSIWPDDAAERVLCADAARSRFPGFVDYHLPELEPKSAKAQSGDVVVAGVATYDLDVWLQWHGGGGGDAGEPAKEVEVRRYALLPGAARKAAVGVRLTLDARCDALLKFDDNIGGAHKGAATGYFGFPDEPSTVLSACSEEMVNVNAPRCSELFTDALHSGPCASDADRPLALPSLWEWAGVLSASRGSFGVPFTSQAFGHGDRMFLDFVLARHPGFRRIVEFGTFTGVTSVILATAAFLRAGTDVGAGGAEAAGPPSLLGSFHTFDITDRRLPRAAAAVAALGGEFHIADLETDPGRLALRDAAAVSNVAEADLLFVDGGTKEKEVLLYAPLLPAGAGLLVHDFDYNGHVASAPHSPGPVVAARHAAYKAGRARNPPPWLATIKALGFEPRYEEVRSLLNACAGFWLRVSKPP